MRRIGWAFTLGAGVLLCSSCGSRATLNKSINSTWQWDGGVEASRVFTRLQGKQGIPPVPAAVGVTAYGLVGRTLPDGKVWNFEAQIDVLPSIVGDTVFFSGAGKVTAIDMRSGEARYTVDVSGRRLEGVGYDGTYTIMLLVDEDDARQDQVRILGPQGQDILRAETLSRLGTPAAIDKVGLIPYAGQYIAAVDLASGAFIGRILYRDGVHTIESAPSGTLVLGAGATLLDQSLASAPDSHSLKLEPRQLPGQPSWPPDGSLPRPARSHPVALYAAPIVKEGALRFADASYIATYYQIIASFERGTNRLRWVNRLERDVLGAAMDASGISVCLEDGRIVHLTLASGVEIPFGSLDARIKACVVSPGRNLKSTVVRPSLFEQITTTLRKTGPDMVAMQTVLLEDLARVPGLETTQALLRMAQDPAVSSDLARKAGALLADQNEGGEEMVRALQDYTASRRELEEETLNSAQEMEQRLRKAAPPNTTKEESAPAQQPTTSPTSDAASSRSSSSNSPASKRQGAAASKPSIAVASATPSTATSQHKSSDEAWSDEDAWKENPAGVDQAVSAMSIESSQLTQRAQADDVARRALRPPPVAALAVALTRLRPPQAAQALAPYLDDPALGAKEVREVMRAIFVLGDEQELSQVQDFLLTYKNTGGEDLLIDALYEAAYFLYLHMDEKQQLDLEKELKKNLTYGLLRERTSGLRQRVLSEKAGRNSQDSAPPATPTERDTPSSEAP